MIHCPVCNEVAEVLDTLDFNKSCEGDVLPESGTQYAYCLCDACGFCFCPEIAAWPKALFEKHIYNADYALVDPDYVRDRPAANAVYLSALLGKHGKRIKHLDYGGGGGALVRSLRGTGWKSTSYDPFVDKALPAEQFDFITAFEVFEHVPDPQALMVEIRSLLAPDGVVLFSTLVSDGCVSRGNKLDWWYAAPRNGHISLFSQRSLYLLAEQHGLKLASYGRTTHIMYTTLPDWFAPNVTHKENN
jgi:SAM-dependent methyltransferase